jgi:hypothetical protein
MKIATIPSRHPLRLTKRRRWALYGVGGGLWASGALWLVLHYFMMQETEFGPSPHPWEHWFLSLHGLFAFASLWMFGLLWSAHIVGGWKSARRRISGSVLFAGLAGLVLTGYLLYYPPSEESLPIVAIIHWGVGLAAVLPFLGHRFSHLVFRTRGQVAQAKPASPAASDNRPAAARAAADRRA